MIAALVQKDVKLFFRNQFFALITGLGLVLYIAMYALLPATVDQALPFALHIEGINTGDTDTTEVFGEGLEVNLFDSEAALVEAVETGEFMAGLILPASAVVNLARGQAITLNVYYAPGTAPEMRDALDSLLASRLNEGLSALPTAPRTGITRTTETLGLDTSEPIPLRDRIIPTLVLLILSVEIMGLATLIVEEIEHGTATALLTTPLSISGFFTAKAVMGVGLAFVQVFVVVLITGKFGTEPLLIALTLLLGGLLVAGIGFLIAALAKDMMSVMGWGMMFLVILTLPSLTLVLPSIGAGWMELIPSFYLVDSLHRVMNFGASWADVGLNLLTLFVIGMGTLIIGSMFLRRQLQ